MRTPLLLPLLLVLLATLALGASRLHAEPADAKGPGDGRGPAATTSPPVELGVVSWLRDFEAAAEKARGSRQALLVLFQEVPG